MQIWWSLSALWDSISYISKFIGKLGEHLILTRVKCFGFHCLILFLFQAVQWNNTIYKIKIQMIMLELNISPSFIERRCFETKYCGIFTYVGDFRMAFWFGLKLPNTQFPPRNISSRHHPLHFEVPPHSPWSPNHSMWLVLEGGDGRSSHCPAPSFLIPVLPETVTLKLGCFSVLLRSS